MESTFYSDLFFIKEKRKVKGKETITISKVTYGKKVRRTKEQLLSEISTVAKGEILEIIDGRKSHYCSCGNISHSPDENVLCDECRMLYGHTYESEL